MESEKENPWITISTKEVYDNNWINVTEHQVINPGGGKGIYGKVHFKNLAIGILVVDEEENIYLVGQYRYPISQYSWEIPEGGGNLGEDPLEAAKRELLEETGITAHSWEIIQRVHLSNSVSDEFGLIYLARHLEYGKAKPEETEQLKLKKVPFSKAYEMVLNGQITDSLSLLAILKAKSLNLVS